MRIVVVSAAVRRSLGFVVESAVLLVLVAARSVGVVRPRASGVVGLGLRIVLLQLHNQLCLELLSGPAELLSTGAPGTC